MPAQTPEECHILLAQAFTARNIEDLLALYAPQAKLLMEGGKEYSGLQGIKEVHMGFLSLKPQVTIQTQSVTHVGDIALLRSHWQIKGTGPDGQPVEMNHYGVEVVQRQANGTWLFLIDLPFGGEI